MSIDLPNLDVSFHPLDRPTDQPTISAMQLQSHQQQISPIPQSNGHLQEHLPHQQEQQAAGKLQQQQLGLSEHTGGSNNAMQLWTLRHTLIMSAYAQSSETTTAQSSMACY